MKTMASQNLLERLDSQRQWISFPLHKIYYILTKDQKFWALKYELIML